MTGGTSTNPHGLLGLQERLQQHVDGTGDSMRDMARKVGDAINHQRFAQLLKEKATRLPYEGKTITALSKLLNVPEITIVKAFLVDMGLSVDDGQSRLAQRLPPGVEHLEAEDIEAVVYLVRRLVNARAAVMQSQD